MNDINWDLVFNSNNDINIIYNIIDKITTIKNNIFKPENAL